MFQYTAPPPPHNWPQNRTRWCPSVFSTSFFIAELDLTWHCNKLINYFIIDNSYCLLPLIPPMSLSL
jgi:hypothetical protein